MSMQEFILELRKIFVAYNKGTTEQYLRQFSVR